MRLENYSVAAFEALEPEDTLLDTAPPAAPVEPPAAPAAEPPSRLLSDMARQPPLDMPLPVELPRARLPRIVDGDGPRRPPSREGFERESVQAFDEPTDGGGLAGDAPAPVEPPAPVAAAPVAAPAPAETPAVIAPAPVPPAAPDAVPPVALSLPQGDVVNPAWLAARETAVQALHADVEAARTAARSAPPADIAAAPGTGWVAAPTDGDGNPVAGSVFVPDAAAAAAAPAVLPAWMLRDGAAPAPQGQWLSFDDGAFEQAYRARLAAQPEASEPLNRLAQLYGQPTSQLLDARPEVWTLATQPHAVNAGTPPVPGLAMGDAAALGQLDLYLADPFITQLRTQLGGTPAAPTSTVALEQQRLYGPARYAELTQLSQALAAVRQTHAAAMQAARDGGGPGWVEMPLQFGTDPETGWPTGQYVTVGDGEILRDANGMPVIATQRVFDEARFTNAWLAEGAQTGGLAQQAFATFYGQAQSHLSLQQDQSENAGPPRWVSQPGLDNPHVALGDSGVWDGDIIALDLNHAPRLNNSEAIGFDPQLGWVTSRDNLYEHRGWFERAMPIVMVAFVGWATAGAGMAAGWGAVGSAAAAGAAASFAGGVINGNLSLKGVLIGAVSGALTAGLTPQLTGVLKDAGLGAAAGVAARMTVQGGIQALLGGKFKDGAIAGFASGLAELTGAHIKANIDEAVKAGTMSATEAFAARTFNTVLGSAIRAAASPGDPAQAFAQEWLGALMQDGLRALPGRAPVPPGSDEDGVRAFPVPGPGPAEAGPLPAPVPPVEGGPPEVQQPAGPAPVDDAQAPQAGVPRLFQYAPRQGAGFSASLVAGGPTDLTVSLDANAAIVSNPDGHYFYASSTATAQLPEGWQVVAGPGQTLMLGVGGRVALPASMSSAEVTLASVLAQPALGMPREWTLSPTGEFSPPAWLSTSVRAGVYGLILSPIEVGGGTQISNISPDIRLVRSGHDVMEGSLELRASDGQGKEQWFRVTHAAYTEAQVRDMQSRLTALLRTDALTPEQIAELGKPLIYVPAPPPAPLPGFTPTPRDPGDNIFVNPMPGPAAPGIEGFPIHEPKTIDELIITSRGFEPGSAEHKAATWDFYKARGGDWGYDSWSSVYDANQVRAAQANAAADRFHQTLNWGTREVTIDGITVDGEATSRRLDIADKALQKGIEYKTGYQTATVDNLWELKRDAELVRRGWDIQWVFRDRASEPLLEALRNAGIRFKVGE